jgi:hypothetical protein
LNDWLFSLILLICCLFSSPGSHHILPWVIQQLSKCPPYPHSLIYLPCQLLLNIT